MSVPVFFFVSSFPIPNFSLVVRLMTVEHVIVLDLTTTIEYLGVLKVSDAEE
jgi:hypothetical protein